MNANSEAGKSANSEYSTFEVHKGELTYPMTCFGAMKRHSDFLPLRDSVDTRWTENYNRRKIAVSNGGVYIFCGDRGTGKTQQAISIMGYFYKVLRKTVLYSTAYDITKGVYSRFNMGKAEKECSDMPTDYLRPSLLVVDAMEVLKGSDAENREMNSIIDKRYGDQAKATILITNDLPETIGEFLGESVVDRANETGGVIFFQGKSFRVRQ